MGICCRTEKKGMLAVILLRPWGAEWCRSEGWSQNRHKKIPIIEIAMRHTGYITGLTTIWGWVDTENILRMPRLVRHFRILLSHTRITSIQADSCPFQLNPLVNQHNYGKSPFLMAKSTNIHYKWPLSVPGEGC